MGALQCFSFDWEDWSGVWGWCVTDYTFSPLNNTNWPPSWGFYTELPLFRRAFLLLSGSCLCISLYWQVCSFGSTLTHSLKCSALPTTTSEARAMHVILLHASPPSYKAWHKLLPKYYHYSNMVDRTFQRLLQWYLPPHPPALVQCDLFPPSSRDGVYFSISMNLGSPCDFSDQ